MHYYIFKNDPVCANSEEHSPEQKYAGVSVVILLIFAFIQLHDEYD